MTRKVKMILKLNMMNNYKIKYNNQNKKTKN